MINSNSLWLLLAIVVVAGINNVQGFLVPQTTKSCSFVPRSIPHYKQTQAQVQVSSSALQMNLFDRFTRVVKGNLNTVLQSLEDPEKIMTQAVEDMQVRTRECDRYIFLYMYKESYWMLFHFIIGTHVTPQIVSNQLIFFLSMDRVIWSRSDNLTLKLQPHSVDC